MTRGRGEHASVHKIIPSVQSTTDAEEDGLLGAEAFFAEHPIEQASQTLEQILERQRVNARVRADNADALVASLVDGV